jgi:transposase InsO family protein
MKRPSTYLKMRVLGAVELAEGATNKARIQRVSQQGFADEDGDVHRFTWRTIQTWHSRYKKDGLTSMKPKPRSDIGSRRKVAVEDVLEAIEQVLPLFRDKTPAKAQVYRACIERGLLRREQIAPNTFRRIVKQCELLKPDSQVQSKRRLAFSKRRANEMWQADTLYGPHVRTPGGPAQTRLIAFIDDASRVLCHGQFFLAENTANLIAALRSAFYKRGLPEALYVDNGSIYSSKEITLICARLGVLLCHAPLRDGAAKGKIERFFRTVRGQFLSCQLDLSSLEVLNRQFHHWVEDDYNARVHSTLGMRPIDRFGLDLPRIRFLPPNETNDELFYMEEERVVKKDNTFSFQARRYEPPRDLRARKIHIRFDRANPLRLVVFYKGERMGAARLLDPVQNDRPPRKGVLPS